MLQVIYQEDVRKYFDHFDSGFTVEPRKPRVGDAVYVLFLDIVSM